MQEDVIKLLEAEKLIKERKDKEKAQNNSEQQVFNQEYQNQKRNLNFEASVTRRFKKKQHIELDDGQDQQDNQVKKKLPPNPFARMNVKDRKPMLEEDIFE